VNMMDGKQKFAVQVALRSAPIDLRLTPIIRERQAEIRPV
jgi:hypothetical protein